MIDIKKHKIVIIEWEDATASNGSEKITEELLKNGGNIAPLISVGFVVSEDDTSITLAGDLFLTEPIRYREIVAIPKSFISNTTYLSPAKEKLQLKNITLNVGDKLQLSDSLKSNASLISWFDASYIEDSVTRTKESIEEKCKAPNVSSVYFLGKDENNTHILGFGNVNVGTKRARCVHTFLPKFISEAVSLIAEKPHKK
jgi:hypothetical protein